MQNFRGLNLKIQQKRSNKNVSDVAKNQRSYDETDLIDTQRALQNENTPNKNLEITNRNQNGQQCETIPINIQSLHASRISPEPNEEATLSNKNNKRHQQFSNYMELTSSNEATHQLEVDELGQEAEAAEASDIQPIS